MSFVVQLRKVWKHTPLISKLEKNKAISLGFPLSEEREALLVRNNTHLETIRNYLTTLLHPNPSQSKQTEELKGKGGREKRCQMPACASTASMLWRSLCILQRWHHWRKISQESASLASVFVLSKSALIYLQNYSDRHASTDVQGCTPSFTAVETGNLTVHRGLMGKLCSC